METNITCPVSVERVNETVVRTVAILVIGVALIALCFHSWIPALFLACDFAFRAFTNGKFSLLRYFAILITKTLNFQPHPIDAAPKRFAAGVGLVFSLFIMTAFLPGWNLAGYVVGGVLIFCAFLEGAFGICLGCMVYSFMVLPFLKK